MHNELIAYIVDYVAKRDLNIYDNLFKIRLVDLIAAIMELEDEIRV